MAFIDSTVVNVALPALQSTLGATVIDAQWVVESYGLFLGALILVGGSVGDLLGRRRTFLAGVTVFAAASAWCGLSPNIHQLVIARAVQGVGAAFLVPGSLALISASFDRKRTWSSYRHLVRLYCNHHGTWPHCWRLADPACFLAMGILHQPSPRRCRDRDFTGPRSRKQKHNREACGLDRGRHCHRGSGRLDLRSH